MIHTVTYLQCALLTTLLEKVMLIKLILAQRLFIFLVYIFFKYYKICILSNGTILKFLRSEKKTVQETLLLNLIKVNKINGLETPLMSSHIALFLFFHSRAYGGLKSSATYTASPQSGAATLKVNLI